MGILGRAMLKADLDRVAVCGDTVREILVGRLLGDI